MKIQAKSGKPETIKTEVLVLATFEGKLSKSAKIVDKKLNGLLQHIIKSKEFKGETGEIFFTNTFKKIPAKHVLLVGMGKEKEFKTDNLRQVIATAATFIRASNIKSFAFSIPETKVNIEESAQALSEGSILGLYQFTDFKTEERDKIKHINYITILCPAKNLRKAKNGTERGRIIAEAVNMARDLTNEPANKGIPSMLANEAKKIAKKYRLKVKVLGKKQIQKLGMHGLLGVSSGSAQEPKFIVLEYNSRKKNSIAIIGKSITFDSGGLDLKPESKMDEMKYDMAAGAAVLGIMQVASQLKLPMKLIGILPAAENVIGADAMRPGDILKSYSGKTIEVLNTDAEGRLTLADALAYASKQKPKQIIDMATLTGACIVALGSHAAGMLGNNEKLMNSIEKAGEKSHERVWQLPLWQEYKDQMKSDIADIKNLDYEGGAGTITAAAFLNKFVGSKKNKIPWVHLDIAGTGWASKSTSYSPKGATGYGVRLMIQFLTDWKSSK
jgi:leucyl aminopeptidase